MPLVQKIVMIPLITVIQWLMAVSWCVYAGAAFFFTVNVDYTSSLNAYLLQYIPSFYVGCIFIGIVIFHIYSVFARHYFMKAFPLFLDVAIMCMFAGALFINRPVALGGVTIVVFALVIIFGILKARYIDYTAYPLKR